VSTADIDSVAPPFPADDPPGPRGTDPSVRVRSDETSQANSIFQQPWWLDAVAPGGWEEATVEQGGETVARLPYVVRGRGRMRVLTQPPLTATLGPWVAQPARANAAKAAGAEQELLAALEAKLPPAQAFRQSFSPTVLGALPFFWAGYRLELRYTYRLENSASEEALWDGLSGNVRGHIRKARKLVEVREDLGLDRFYSVWAKTFERQGLHAPDFGRLERIEAACGPRGARTMLFAQDETGQIHAVAYVVWDRHGAYYLLSGGDPELRRSGAQSLLLWEAIVRARSTTDVFDFEGSMLKPVERFFRDFGGRQTPYLHVSRATGPAQAAFALRGAVQRLTSRRSH
jgi:hypothetical protein